MKKMICVVILSMISTACGSYDPPIQSAISKHVWTPPSDDARSCCDCLLQTGCYIPPQTKIEPGCYDTMSAGGVPNYMSHCLAGKPGVYPQGVCTDECASLFD